MVTRLERQNRGGNLARRLAWFVALWGVGVGSVAVIACLLKALMHVAGLR